LENNETNIYIRKKKLKICKIIVLADPNSLNSIEEISDKYEEIQYRYNRHRKMLTPETEFWAHCSNLQAWAENNYSPVLLDFRLAEPILKELVIAGDFLAKEQVDRSEEKNLENGDIDTWYWYIKSKSFYILSEEQFEKLSNNLSEDILEDLKKQVWHDFGAREAYLKKFNYDRDTVVGFLKKLYDEKDIIGLISKNLGKKIKRLTLGLIGILLFSILLPSGIIQNVEDNDWFGIFYAIFSFTFLTIYYFIRVLAFRDTKRYLKETCLIKKKS
jgi:hypothetical protein